VYQQFSGPRTRQVQVAPSPAPTSTGVSFVALAEKVPPETFMPQFHAVYDLKPGELVKPTT